MSSDGAAGSGESDLKERLRRSGIVAAFAVTQLFGWASTYSTHAILARPIADDLSITLTEAVTGSSAFLISMALASQLAGRLYRTIGAARLMAAGSLFMVFALSMVAVSNSLVTYFAAWLLVGFGGAAILTTSAHTVLVTVLGRSARSWIAGLMLISGLSSSLGYPMTAALESWIGWRDTYLFYALLHGVLCLPLHLLVCRLVGRERQPDSGDAAAADSTSRRDRILFLNLAIAISMLGVVTWGFTIVVVELFVSLRIPQEEAVALAASIGLFQIAARLMEFLFAGGRSPIRTGLEAAVLMAVGFLVLAVADGWIAGAVFVVFYGLSSGVLNVVRSTLPLELFDPSAYGMMMSRLSLPMLLSFAAAPILFGGILERFGPDPALALACVLAVLAFVFLWNLKRLAHR